MSKYFLRRILILIPVLAGISVVQIGHSHPRWVEAVQEQAERLAHVGNLFYTEQSMRLARRPQGWSATFRRRASRPLQGPDTGCSMTSRRRCWVRSGSFLG